MRLSSDARCAEIKVGHLLKAQPSIPEVLCILGGIESDLVLQAVGRTPSGKKIAADPAGVAVTERGFINVDIQMRSKVLHIFAIGDIVGQPMLAHEAAQEAVQEAVHDAYVAAKVIAGDLQGNKGRLEWRMAAARICRRSITDLSNTDIQKSQSRNDLGFWTQNVRYPFF